MSVVKKETIVIGHKNPDTDSICSALAYANLKNQISEDKFVAKCAGDLNSETRFVLDYFGVDTPDYVDDVSTQVRDIDINDIESVDPLISLKDAWIIMRENGSYTLPVETSDRHLAGLITNSDVAHVILDRNEHDLLAEFKTPFTNILKTLDAELITGEIENRIVERGKVIIAEDNPELMEESIQDGDIVILGNRYECQLCAIEMNAACIIICEGTKVTKTIQKLAADHGCIVMVSPYDVFTISKLINQSVPVKSFMTTDGIVQFKTDDFIEEVKNIMAKKRYRDFPVVDHKGRFVGLISRRRLLNINRKKVILVDHSDLEQAVDGIEEAEIIEIVDHHRLGTITTSQPMFFRNLPWGCTATIIYQMYKEKNVKVDKANAGLMLSAILSDTLLFRSPTCTEIDKLSAEELAEIAEVDVHAYAEEMFAAGSMLNDKSAEEIFYQDYKKFSIDDTTLGVGQVNSISERVLKDIEGKILDYIKTKEKSKNVDILFFLLTDIDKCSTKVLFTGNRAKDIIEEAFNVKTEPNSAFLEGVVSRKKQFIPAVTVAMQY
ncbi:MAG: putative manganese-dependent inorganic diphosphatase [Lachnospiraceae bacterium]|nr:putative manganese-dependent inorganic diphosphatase [Lachnospiraceae bacterium]